ncbi:uncharacterized protein B0H18DRAFT_981943 [Fomitopsis serialis]|uniref:uncharacterized protein n=1 Tax=Fomitopsis serialis TaxID=139415 RepID=UPI0020077669|nr:uncharacterized protein B0H18DRAFT_981943 [Neoantrodia serialis]KAH9933774.1 hypothetical protein B0H18DRAFT_981943 [Neoantrodia serialis]
MFFKDWHTFIHCDGDLVDEFDFRIVDDNTVSCYIPSEAGKSFAVRWQNDLYIAAAAECFMDGQRMGSSNVDPGERGARNGVRTNGDYKQYFQFAPLATTDDDDVADPDDPMINNLGVIEVRVYRIRYSHEVFRPNNRHRPQEFAERPPVHERSKKAGTHCVRLGEGKWFEPTAHSGPRRIYIDNRKHPYIRFIFRYQPRAMLQAQGIIPRDYGTDAYHQEQVPALHPSRKRNSSVLYMGSNAGSAGPSNYRASVKPEPRLLEDRLGSEYYDDMQVEDMLRARSAQYDAFAPYAQPQLQHDLPPAPRRHPFVIDVDADVIDLTQDED